MLPKHSGRRVGSELRRIYNGDAEAAEQAVEQLCCEPRALEAWATRMLRAEPMPSKGERMPNTGPQCEPFSWDEVPGPMREAAIRGMAMAYLVETSREETA